MRDESLLSMASRVAEQARAGEQIEAYVSRRRDTDIKVFNGQVESCAVAASSGVGVRVIVDGRQGYAWAGSLDHEVIEATVLEARDNAAFGTADEHLGLPTVAEAGKSSVVLDLWRDDLLSVSDDRKIALTLELERMAKAGDARIRAVEASEYGDALVEAAIASSLGVRAEARQTVCSCSVGTLAGEDAETRSGYGFSFGRSIDELDLTKAAADAVERTVRLLGAKQVPSQRLAVVLDPLVMSSIVGLVAGALSGEAVLKGRSMFAGRLGEEVGARSLRLLDDPTNPLAYAASEVDSEGVATRPVDLIEGGVLRGYLHNTYTARRTGGGVRTTGSAIRGGYRTTPGVGARALRLAWHDAGVERPTPVDEMMQMAGTALYVQSVKGLHSGANPVSGDFSVGVDGLMIRDGALAEPVREVTVASSLQRMLTDIVAIGDDVQWLPGAAAASTLLISEMALSGA